MRKQSRSGKMLAVLLLAGLMFGASASFSTHLGGLSWRSHSRYARYSHSYRYRSYRMAAFPAGTDVWARLRACESGGNYARNSGNGYYGAYQFAPSTWRSLGYSGLPNQASAAVQDQAAQRLQARSGWGQWPSCSRAIGLR